VNRYDEILDRLLPACVVVSVSLLTVAFSILLFAISYHVAVHGT
jgi:hypothetical protein